MSTAADMVAAYQAAELAVLTGKSYQLGTRQLTRENLSEIRAGRKEWEARLRNETVKTGGGNSLFSVADFTE